MESAGVVALVVFILVIGAALPTEWVTCGQRHLIEAKWRMVPIEAPTLPRWRLEAGWAAYTLSALWLCIFLAGAYWHAHSWGWTYLMAAWLLWFAIFLCGIWLAEWCWKPSREAQTGKSEEHPE
jgi:hypothetical protein